MTRRSDTTSAGAEGHDLPPRRVHLNGAPTPAPPTPAPTPAPRTAFGAGAIIAAGTDAPLVQAVARAGLPRRIGVAVSGGSDSLATLLLLARHHEVRAVTVDHGLRPEATEEAAFVARLCAERGIAHEVLHWNGRAARGNLMDAARRARLALIGAWARGHGLDHVALGHTADDQAETFLMRLGRAAGTEGLAGMRAAFPAHGVTFARPVLGLGRAALRDWLTGQGVAWVEDPSNDDPRFARVRARRALAALADLGIDAQSLSQVTANIARTEGFVTQQLADWVTEYVTQIGGDLVLDLAPFQQLAPELQRRFLAAALRWISCADYAPRAQKLQGLTTALQGLADSSRAFAQTLHGCRITLARGRLWICREHGALARHETPAPGAWDRWRLVPDAQAAARLSHASEAPVIRPLGEVGLAQWGDWRALGVPRAALLAHPGLWHDDALVAAPTLDALHGTGAPARAVPGAADGSVPSQGTPQDPSPGGWQAHLRNGSFASSLFRR